MAIVHSIKHKLNILRIYESAFIPSFYELTVQIVPFEDASNSDMTDAVGMIEIFLMHVFSSGIIFKYDNKIAHEFFFPNGEEVERDNFPISTPDEPGDEIILHVLFKKLNAIIPDTIFVTALELDNIGINHMTFYDGEFVELPTAKDMAGPLSYYDEAWWDRADMDTFDYAGDDEEDVKEFREAILNESNEDEDKTVILNHEKDSEHANVIAVTFGFKTKDNKEPPDDEC